LSSERKGITDEKIKEVINSIREEAENFNVDITD
jgi:hydrogenase maturation factor